MPSLIVAHPVVVPTEYVDLAPGQELTETAQTWARERPSYAGYLVLQRTGGQVRARRRYLVASGQVRRWQGLWPSSGECRGHARGHHLAVLRFDQEFPPSPWVWICHWCGVELSRWPWKAVPA